MVNKVEYITKIDPELPKCLSNYLANFQIQNKHHLDNYKIKLENKLLKMRYIRRSAWVGAAHRQHKIVCIVAMCEYFFSSLCEKCIHVYSQHITKKNYR